MTKNDKELYILATKAQIQTTEQMMLPQNLEQMRFVIASDQRAAEYLKKMLDTTLDEVNLPSMQEALRDEEMRVVTEELHKKVQLVKNELFPEVLN